jgi:hypothetical protein
MRLRVSISEKLRMDKPLINGVGFENDKYLSSYLAAKTIVRRRAIPNTRKKI